MNKLKCPFLILLPFLISNCAGQQSSKNDLFVADFKWKINIPEFLITENQNEWKKIQDAGKKAIEDTYNRGLKNKVKTVFIFKSNDNSFFEAASEPISEEMAVNYVETCERMNNIFYNTIKAQVPIAKIDTTKSVEIIDNLDFQTLRIKVLFPNGSSKTTISYRRVFDNSELTVNVMYANRESGEKIIESFKGSKFDVTK